MCTNLKGRNIGIAYNIICLGYLVIKGRLNYVISFFPVGFITQALEIFTMPQMQKWFELIKVLSPHARGIIVLIV